MFAPMTNSYYRIPKISEQLQPQLDEIDKKYGKNKEKRTKAISDLLVRNDYPFFAFVLYYVAVMAFAVLMSLCTHNASTYVTGFDPQASLRFLMIPDVTSFTYAEIKNSWPYINVLLYVILPAAAVVLQYLHSSYMMKKSLVDTSVIHYVMLAVTVVAVAILPATFSIFWIVYQLASMIQIYFNLKYKGFKIKKDETSGNSSTKKR